MELSQLVRAAKRTNTRVRAVARGRRKTRQELWVFGAAAGADFTDNAAVLFSYVVSTRPDIEAVWLGTGLALDEARRLGGEALALQSVEAHVATQQAGVVVFSHGVHDVAGLYSNHGGVVVRLGHGLTAFKQTAGTTPLSLRRMVRRVDLAPVASEMEAAHKSTWGFQLRQMPITGLARWDEMITRRLAKSNDERTSILFAPTWRGWLDSRTLGGSPLWHALTSSLLSDELSELAEATGSNISLFAHPLIRRPLTDAVQREHATVEMIDSGSWLPDALARARLLVTDYSSLAWDALYLGVPVVFLHPDVDDYLAHRASFIDLRGRLFGPTVRSGGELLGVIEEFFAHDEQFPDYSEDIIKWRARAFAYTDARNSERVLAAIEDALRNRD